MVSSEPMCRPCVPDRMRITILAAFLVASVASAQHCGYDFAAIIVVRPHLAGDSAIVHALRVTLLDSTNLPYLHNGYPGNIFLPNTDLEACNRTQGAFAPGHDVCFPFAKDNYVLVIPSGLKTEGMKVLVQDERPRTAEEKRKRIWPKRFTTQVIPLSAFDSYPLCGVFDEAEYPIQAGRPPFTPILINLQPR